LTAFNAIAISTSLAIDFFILEEHGVGLLKRLLALLIGA